MPDTDVSPTAEQVDQFATTLVHLFKIVRSARRAMPRVHPAVDPMSYPVLYAAAPEPVRVSSIAAKVFSDVSTVSRQVSTLVAHGLIEKVPDPADGRAQLLQLSEAGSELLGALNDQRTELFSAYLADWDGEDVARFTDYLERLTHAVEEDRSRSMAAVVR